jgi:CheY-like chemotaxis protein
MPQSKPRVLIVDDNRDTVDVLLRALRRHGYTDLATAPTVSWAVGLLTGALPDVILLDLSLSLHDGHVLLRHVRGAPHRSAVPVFMLTGRHSSDAIKAAVQEGATGFISQPLNGLEIVYKIEQAVSGLVLRSAELNDLLDRDP